MNTVLQLTPLPVPAGYRPPCTLPIEHLPEGHQRDAWLAQHGAAIRVVITHSLRGVPEALWARLPGLQFVANFGAGLDLIDLKHAAAHGILVTHTPDLLTHDVADLAFGLLLMLCRQLAEANDYVRSGAWGQRPFAAGRSTRGRRLGLLGFGRIGKAIAARAEAFEMPVGYHSRSPAAVSHPYFSTLLDLAAWSDILIAAVPGGHETRHLINAPVLAALGGEGLLINIARGSVVDSAALADALARGVIAGAGLDVFETQPIDGTAFKGLPNVILTPHIGSATTDTRMAMADAVYRNVDAFLAGKTLQNLAVTG